MVLVIGYVKQIPELGYIHKVLK